jgi:hypothetical protein
VFHLKGSLTHGRERSMEARDIMTTANSNGLGTMSGTLPTTSHPTIPSFGRIATLESLQEHSQWAIELEHFTLRPYLCARYSLEPGGRNPEATEVVRSVLVDSSPCNPTVTVMRLIIKSQVLR